MQCVIDGGKQRRRDRHKAGFARGLFIEIAVKCDGGTVYAYRGLDETPITVGEKVNVFLYRLFITKGDEVQILRNKSLQEESVII